MLSVVPQENPNFITPRVSDGCNSFDIVCLCVCVSVCLSVTTLTSKQTYGPDFWCAGQVERYLGQVERSRS